MSEMKIGGRTKSRGGRASQRPGRMGLVAGLLVVLALVVVACGPAAEPAAPAVEVASEPTAAPAVSEPTPAPAPTEAPVAEDAVSPAVTVQDQDIEGATVTIAEVVSDGPGWLVVHADADGRPGAVLGYAGVADGTSSDVVVEIDPSSATGTLYAMLHTDAGEQGVWEFPEGPDAPVTVGEQVVTPAFAVTGGLEVAEEVAPVPSVTVADQEVVDGMVTIAEVVSAGPGWLVIHAQADGKPGPILGYGQVVDGANADVTVEIDASGATGTLYAMLHTDAGEIGVWEFPEGPDTPVTVGEQVVTPAFAVTGGLEVAEEVALVPSVTVADQEVVDGMVTIAEVVSAGPGWLVIHAQADGKPGPVLGYSQVLDGANADVTVEIDASGATGTLYAMLHTDAGEIGVWEFPEGPDTPVTVGEQVVTPAFAVTGGPEKKAEKTVTPSVTVADQGLSGSRVTIAQVISNGPGWLVVHAQADGKPGPVLGYSPVVDGANNNVAVDLDLTAATATLYAMLHTDAGEVGTWEFPNGPDAPATSSGQVVSPAFNLFAQPGDEAEVEIEDFAFNPKTLVIRAGTTVKFANKDEAPHTATSDTGVWDSGYLAKGEEFFFTFTEPGLYPYYCIPHGGPGGVGMAATIIVLR